MLNNYREILSIPGAWKFSAAGLLARFPMSMVGLSLILMISQLYGNYTIAGQVGACSVIAFAIVAPILARLVDRYGQAEVMRPDLLICVLALIGLIAAAILRWPVWTLYLFAVIGGATSGSLGAMVRSRWSHAVSTPSQLHTAFSLESTLDELVFMTGPIIATFATTLIHPTAGLAIAGVFIVIGGMWFLSQRSTQPPPLAPIQGVKHRSVMRSRAMFVLAFIYVGMGAMFGAIDVATVAFCTEHGWKAASGIVLGVYAAGSMISGFLYGVRTWRLSLPKLFAIGVVLLALGNTVILAANSITTLCIIVFFTGFACSPTMINVTSLIERIVPNSRLTEGLTWMSTAINIGVAGGSAIAGRTVDAHGSGGAWWFMVMCAWAMMAVMVVTLPVLRASLRAARARAVSDPK